MDPKQWNCDSVVGPIVGGPFPKGDTTPLAISKRYFDEICEDKFIVRPEEVTPLHGDSATAVEITAVWLDYLAKIKSPCIEIVPNAGLIYHVL